MTHLVGMIGGRMLDSSQFAGVIWGKALALSVLLMSLSGQMGAVTGVDYFNADSFLACLVVAVALACLLKLLAGARTRLCVAGVTAALALGWVALLLVLQYRHLSGEGLDAVALAVYAFLGRIVTLLVNIEWNYQFALNSAHEASRPAAAAVLLALLLFGVFTVTGGFVAQALVIIALAASAGMGLWNSYVEASSPEAPRSARAVAERDSLHPASADSRRGVRVLYFGSRCLYGLALGVLVCLSAPLGPAPVERPDLALAALAVALAIWAAAGLGMLSDRGERALVVATPLVSCAIVYIAFAGSAPGASPLCLAALLAEVTWTTQNLFQLPAYRRICGMGAGTFAYGDYVAQIVPYYLAVWALSRDGVLARYLELAGIGADAFGLACFALLVCSCTFAMARHALVYLPRGGAEMQRADDKDHLEAAAIESARTLEALTPRERDVFALMAAGYSRTYIGKVLYIAPDTVKVHAKHIYAKLGIGSKDDLIRLAQETGTESRP